MENRKHALVLTGELLPGSDAARAWPEVAKFFRIDDARLKSDVLARVPMTIKESEDLGDLEKRRQSLGALGVASEIHALSGKSCFALIDNVPRGPLPRSFIEQRVRSGAWPANTRVAAVGTTDWRPFDAEPASVAVAPATPAAAPDATVDEADTVAAKIARVADSVAGRLNVPRVLPAGAAIHAGFWRRCAAYLIDGLVLFVPGLILMLIPILGILLYFVGRWLYFALMESSQSQATLGKRAMGLIVTDGKGQRLGFGQASGRYFAGAVSYITLYIGYALAGWTERKQALHDLIADTCVVFDTVRPGEELPTVRPPMPWYGWAANCLLLAIFPIAILAAIAIPAYNDYVIRAKTATAMIEIPSAKAEVIEALAAGGGCPNDVRPGGNAMVESISFAGTAPNCVITLTFASDSEVPANVRAQPVELAYAADGNWTCSSPIASKYLPAECR
ncbi:MAG: RDD family protein [Dokdonella sp.]|nr:RDD family protein [Dokdonella sp.]MCB1570130.1 RDD family protein [Xanthomonadales bacterium]MCB1573170.1 RDD family protein [Xanthomonadales bacterium]